MTGSLPAPGSKPIRVLIADGNALYRASLVHLLSAQPDIEVVAEISDAEDGERVPVAPLPDVAMLDAQPPARLAEFIRMVSTAQYRPHVLVFGVTPDDTLLTDALAAGVLGLVDRAADIQELIRAIRTVAAGEFTISPRLAQHITRTYANLADPKKVKSATDTLTQRELEVLQLIAMGCSNREAAAGLRLSEHTIRAHLRNMARKFGTSNRVQAVSHAIRHGLVRSDLTSDRS